MALSKLATLRRQDTATPETTGRDWGRLVHDLDGMFRDLPRAFVERWLPGRGAVTSSTTRPTLKFGELVTIAEKHATTRVYLPKASPSDAGKRCPFVKKFAARTVEIIPTDGSLINGYDRWPSVTEVGLHEVWWDGTGWWIREPAAKARGHAVTPGTIGLWQFTTTTDGLADSSGNGRTMTVETGTERYTYITGTLGGFYFDGSTALIYDVADADLRLTGDMTFMCLLIQIASVNGAYWFSHTAGDPDDEDNNQLYGLTASPAPALSWTQENGAGTNSTYTGANMFMPTGQLVHMGVTRESNVITTYLHGRVWGVPSSALTTPTGGANGRLRIGGNTATRINAVMTSAKLMNRAASAAEMMEERNYTLGGAQGWILDA